MVQHQVAQEGGSMATRFGWGMERNFREGLRVAPLGDAANQVLEGEPCPADVWAPHPPVANAGRGQAGVSEGGNINGAQQRSEGILLCKA